jgi:hypothetical protein
MTNPLLRGHIQAVVPAVRLKYNNIHITISQYNVTGAVLLTLTEMAQDSTCFNLIKIRSLIALGFAMSRFKFKTGSN